MTDLTKKQSSGGDTIGAILARNASKHGSEIALREKERGIWKETTWAEYAEEVLACAAGLEKIGVTPGKAVLILGDNRARLYGGMLAISLLGAYAMPAYPGATLEELRHFLGEVEIVAAIAEDQEQVDKILELKDAGAEIVDISLPHTKYALPAYYVIAPAEASSNLARYDGVRYGHRAKLAQGDGITEMYEKTRAEGFGDEVQRRVMIGTYVLSAGFYDAYYNRARKVRTLIKKDFEDAFAQGVDAILTPATPSSAFGLGEMAEADPVQMYLNDVFTVTVNLAGLPGISVPAGLDKQGLPLGLQLIGKPWDEGDLLNIAASLEKSAGFVAKPAQWW